MISVYMSAILSWCTEVQYTKIKQQNNFFMEVIKILPIILIFDAGCYHNVGTLHDTGFFFCVCPWASNYISRLYQYGFCSGIIT